MEAINIKWDADGQGAAVLQKDGEIWGRMDISLSDTLLTVYHTEVDPRAEGKGYARQLLTRLVAYARENGYRILPLCPYVHLQFKRHAQEYEDVWHHAS